MGEYDKLFKFAAKTGSLEGYLYQRDKIESLYNWIDNIDTMYQKVPESVKGDVKEAYAEVLRRILVNGESILPEDLNLKLKRMLLEVEGS